MASAMVGNASGLAIQANTVSTLPERQAAFGAEERPAAGRRR